MPFIIALLAPVFWGTTYALVSLYLHDMSPYWVAVWRALPAGILMLMLRPRLPTLVWSKLGLLATLLLLMRAVPRPMKSSGTD